MKDPTFGSHLQAQVLDLNCLSLEHALVLRIKQHSSNEKEQFVSFFVLDCVGCCAWQCHT